MIVSMGIDIIEIEDIKKSIEKSKCFVERVFTPDEISYCERKPNKYQHYAARFTTKEAAMKAIGTGWDKGVQWKQIEVINADRRPETGNRTPDTGDRRMETGEGKTKKRSIPIPDKNNGKPQIRLTGKALEIVKEMGVENIVVSLSHSKNYAVANVIFEGNCKPKNGDRKPEEGRSETADRRRDNADRTPETAGRNKTILSRLPSPFSVFRNKAVEVGIINKSLGNDFIERTKKISSMLFNLIKIRKEKFN